MTGARTNKRRKAPGRNGRIRLPAAALALITGLAAFAATPATAAPPSGLTAVGVESQYADVIAQVGGKYVEVSTIESDPNTDPHVFEVSPKIAEQIAAADLVVENGIGYDDWADKIIAAAPRANRRVINVQHLLGLPDSTPNPHLWYNSGTMPAVAEKIATTLTALSPANAGYFQKNAENFIASLKPWNEAIAAFRTDFPRTPVATTEPVGDYMLGAAGMDKKTPFNLEAAIMNGTDPAPQDVTLQNDLLAGHKVLVFVYNQQVTDPLTDSFLSLAKKNGVPIVGVYETMPAGYHYQSWMLAEMLALRKAVTTKGSTETLAAPP